MDYEKKYKETLERAGLLIEKLESNHIKGFIYNILPELKENENEKKIRKELVDLLRELAAQHFPLIPDIKRLDEWIAWLENQEYTFEIKEGHWYKCVADYMLNNSDLMFKNDRLYYCSKDWRLIGEIDERNVKDIGVKGYKSFFRPATNQEIKDWLEKKGEHTNFLSKIQVGDKVTKNEDGVLVIIPKFRIGDEIKTTNEEPLIITKIDEKGYWSEDLFICNFDEECIWDLVNEQKPVEWSEQQGKTALEAINEEKVDNANKVEPKFKVGDWIIENGLGKKPIKIVRFEKRDDGTLVWFNNSTGIYIDYLDNYYHLWSIDDAKAGDILITNANPFIYKGRLDPKNPDSPVAYCGIDCLGDFYYCENDDYWDDAEVYPATEEQCNLLFKKMKEAGYEWDAENKKLINKYSDMYSKIKNKIDNLQTSVKRNYLTNKDMEFLNAINDLLEK